MICQVCKQDHTDKNMRWCDRSDLKIENDYLRAENARYIERIEELTSELSKLKVQADRYREALEFYANPFNHKEKIENETSIPDFYGETDFGMFAREALKGGE
jgi:hypothetical protein